MTELKGVSRGGFRPQIRPSSQARCTSAFFDRGLICARSATPSGRYPEGRWPTERHRRTTLGRRADSHRFTSRWTRLVSTPDTHVRATRRHLSPSSGPTYGATSTPPVLEASECNYIKPTMKDQTIGGKPRHDVSNRQSITGRFSPTTQVVGFHFESL